MANTEELPERRHSEAAEQLSHSTPDHVVALAVIAAVVAVFGIAATFLTALVQAR